MGIKVDRQAAEILRIADESILTSAATWGRKTGKGRFTLAGAVLTAAGPLFVDAGDEAEKVAHEANLKGIRVAAVTDDLESFRGAKAVLKAARHLLADRIARHEAKIARARDKRIAARRKAQREARTAARAAADFKPKPDQVRYITQTLKARNYDPNVVIGGPKPKAKPVSRTRAAVAASKARGRAG